MRPWKSILTALWLTAVLVAGCATESKRAQEEARIEARAQELAELIVRKAKAVDTVAVAITEDGKTLDKRLVNPPGTVWKSGIQGMHFEFYESIIFYASGRWVEPNKIRVNCGIKCSEPFYPCGTWFTENSKIIKQSYGTSYDTVPYVIGNDPEGGEHHGTVYLKLYDRSQMEWLWLCNPESTGGCWGVEKSVLEFAEISLKELETLVNKQPALVINSHRLFHP